MTMTLADFLLARIAEDQRSYGLIVAEMAQADPPVPFIDLAARVLAECEAKRQIVEYRISQGYADDGMVTALCALASVYADHPDYNSEWAL